jgi:hypothetical protein
MWRHIFALGPLIMIGMVVFSAMNDGGAQPIRYGHHADFAVSQRAARDRLVTAAAPIPGELSAIFFVIDCFRRKYHGNRVPAAVLALSGLLTLGLTSLLYYLFWGYRPLKGRDQVYGDQFCAQCLAATDARPAPGALAVNVILGTRYLGASEPCARCRSVVRTLWLWILFPLVPLGSYRIISLDGKRFIGRHVRMYWPQITAVYGIALSVFFLAVILVAARH